MSAEHCGAVSGGDPELLGATPLVGGTNFAFYTGAAAQGVQVCVYPQKNPFFERRYDLTAKQPVEQDGGIIGYIWHGVVPDARESDLYGFRVDGPYAPEKGFFFNPNKLLIDFCAREVTHELHQWDPLHFPHNREDNASLMPKGRIVDWRRLESQTKQGFIHPHTDSVILEMHVKGATCLHPDIPPEIRGTYKALSHPAFIAWLQDMCFTTVEVQPPGAYGSDVRLAGLGMSNYWGYMPMAPMAPHTGYAASKEPMREFHESISILRAHGIEVVVDVVPNHTLESRSDGPVINLRGMDSTLYLDRDYTGSGNTRDFGHPMNVRFFLEELRHWKRLGVSGFRIDLATIVGRVHGKDFDPHSPMMRAIREDAFLRDVKFYGEPWDLGPNCVQCGNLCATSPGASSAQNIVAEWDRVARDVLPQAALGHKEIPRNWIINALAGQLLPPYARVTKIGSHDGPTLDDMVAYLAKQNGPNGEDGRDGNEINPDGFWVSEQDRLRVERFAFSLLAITQGIPMTTLGHERCKSQNGNTNPYCQDNNTSYIPWNDAVTPQGRDLMAFVKECNMFRAAHPSLRRATLFAGQADLESGLTFADNPMKDVTWLDPFAQDFCKVGAIDWLGGFQMLLSGDPGNSPPHEQNLTRLVMRSDRDSPLLALINPTGGDIEFLLPEVAGIVWKQVLNSLDSGAVGGEPASAAQSVKVGYHALIMFEGMRTPLHQSTLQFQDRAINANVAHGVLSL